MKKKICHEGLLCKYINEYQHSLEFNHIPKEISKFPGKGRKLENNVTNKAIYEPFKKKGRTLRGVISKNTEDLRTSIIPSQGDQIINISADNLVCYICGYEIALNSIDAHISQHEIDK